MAETRIAPPASFARAGRSGDRSGGSGAGDAMPPARSSRAVPARSLHAAMPLSAGRHPSQTAGASARTGHTDALRPRACRHTCPQARRARCRRLWTWAEYGRSCLAAFSRSLLPAPPAGKVHTLRNEKSRHRRQTVRVHGAAILPAKGGPEDQLRHRDATPKRRRVYTSPPPPVKPLVRTFALPTSTAIAADAV